MQPLKIEQTIFTGYILVCATSCRVSAAIVKPLSRLEAVPGLIDNDAITYTHTLARIAPDTAPVSVPGVVFLQSPF